MSITCIAEDGGCSHGRIRVVSRQKFSWLHLSPNASIHINVNVLQMPHKVPVAFYSGFEMHLESITTQDDSTRIHKIENQ